MKKIWLTLFSLIIAVLLQMTNVQADGNQVSFSKVQDNVVVKATLPTETQVHALKVTLKVTSQEKTAPTFEFTPALQATSKVHEVRYDAKKQTLTLYLADLNALDFSQGVTLGEFSDIPTKITFSAESEIEVVNSSEASANLLVQANTLVVDNTPTTSDDDKNQTDDDENIKPSGEENTDPQGDTASKDKPDTSKTQTKRNQGVLGQTGEEKSFLLTAFGTLIVVSVGAVYWRSRY